MQFLERWKRTDDVSGDAQPLQCGGRNVYRILDQRLVMNDARRAGVLDPGVYIPAPAAEMLSDDDVMEGLVKELLCRMVDILLSFQDEVSIGDHGIAAISYQHHRRRVVLRRQVVSLDEVRTQIGLQGREIALIILLPDELLYRAKAFPYVALCLGRIHRMGAKTKHAI